MPFHPAGNRSFRLRSRDFGLVTRIARRLQTRRSGQVRFIYSAEAVASPLLTGEADSSVFFNNPVVEPMHQPTWSQTVDEATVRLPVEADVAKVDVRLTSLPRKLQVSIRRQVVCDVQLHAEVEHEVRKPYICMRTYRDIARAI